ncbi:MAG: hypothetical protein AAGA70_04195 [Pseudomonadota bacterium]
MTPMKSRLAAMLVLLWAVEAQAQGFEYPEFAGVYLRVGDDVTEMPGVASYRGFVFPPDHPSTYSRSFDFSPRPFLGTTISSQNVLFLPYSFALYDYYGGASTISTSRPATETVSVITVQRAGFVLDDWITEIVSTGEMIAALRELTPAEQARCDDDAARGIAPLAGGFNECRAGEASFENLDVAFSEVGWGYGLNAVTDQRLVDEFTTEYIFDRSQITLCLDETADLSGRIHLPHRGYFVRDGNGTAYIFACENQMPTLID